MYGFLVVHSIENTAHKIDRFHISISMIYNGDNTQVHTVKSETDEGTRISPKEEQEKETIQLPRA